MPKIDLVSISCSPCTAKLKMREEEAAQASVQKIINFGKLFFGGGNSAELTRLVTACRYEEMWAGGKDVLPKVSAWLEKRVVGPVGAWAAASGYGQRVNSTYNQEE